MIIGAWEIDETLIFWRIFNLAASLRWLEDISGQICQTWVWLGMSNHIQKEILVST